MREAKGFIVAAWDEARSDRRTELKEAPRIFVTGRLEDGRSFAAIFPGEMPSLFVPAEMADPAFDALKEAFSASAFVNAAERGTAEWTDLGGSPIARIRVPREHLWHAARTLETAGIGPVIRDSPRADEILAASGIRGHALVRGEESPGRRVDAVFSSAELRPELNAAAPRWMALDIETDREGRVVAVSLSDQRYGGEVLFLGPETGSREVRSFGSEAELLDALVRRVVERDPDVVTGWNVVDFDLRVLAGRYAALGIPFLAGRTTAPASLVELEGRRSVFDLPGRAVLDAMRLVRASGERFDDLSLESVSRTLFGEGKDIASRGESKLDELDRLREGDPAAFCAYCLRDSDLVLRVLRETRLDQLTARRAALTGVSLDLAWTSIPAFERIYSSELRSRRVLPPPKEARRVSGAAGGTVLEAVAGMFPDVIVLDFRSLYPSIMRTFNIDPLAHARAGEDAIVAPNGARFDRSDAIMPELIARYAKEREAAIAAGDATGAYVLKILQNSFYGVLGAEGCRFARTELAGAITSFGKLFLIMARDHFEAKGRRVLYGDTDSVFVLAGSDGSKREELMDWGNAEAEELNGEIAQRVSADWGLPSHLRIRCEKAYRRFLIPRLRVDSGGAGRGRAKGYAGLLLLEEGGAEVEVKGMEAARSDFTPLARRFQVELLSLAFSGADEDRLRDFCRAEVAALLSGRRDAELVYRKSLRRPAEDYGSQTPQVKAARAMGWTTRRGRISYVMTRSGAEPLEARSGSLFDYGHYVAKQLAPIAISMADALGIDATAWFGSGDQLEMDFR